MGLELCSPIQMIMKINHKAVFSDGAEDKPLGDNHSTHSTSHYSEMPDDNGEVPDWLNLSHRREEAVATNGGTCICVLDSNGWMPQCLPGQ